MNVSVGGLKEQHENWKAARERLFRPAAKPQIQIVAPVVKPVIEVQQPQPRPLWTWADVQFDWHVHAWREAVGHSVSDLVHENAAMRMALRVAEIDAASCTVRTRRPIQEIVADVLRDFPGIERVDIDSHHRTKDIIYPRHLCFYEVVEQRSDLSFPQIGRYFGGRDHTTIIYGHRKIAEMTADERRRELALQRKYCKKRRKYARERIRELEAAAE